MRSRSGFSSLLLAGALLATADAPGRQPGSAEDTAVKAMRTGVATWYGQGLHGRKTASGEMFDSTRMVAAHPSYPAGTRARVTNLRNGRSQEVRIIDRGPAPEHQRRGVIIDVSEAVAASLAFRKKGRTRVKVEVLEWGRK